MKLIETGRVDMILCDLPYGATHNKWDSIIPFGALWEQYKRIIKPDGAIALTEQIPFSITVAASNLAWLKYEWIWKKSKATGRINANRRPLNNHEDVLVFSKRIPAYDPQTSFDLMLQSYEEAEKGTEPITANRPTIRGKSLATILPRLGDQILYC